MIQINLKNFLATEQLNSQVDDFQIISDSNQQNSVSRQSNSISTNPDNKIQNVFETGNKKIQKESIITSVFKKNTQTKINEILEQGITDSLEFEIKNDIPKSRTKSNEVKNANDTINLLIEMFDNEENSAISNLSDQDLSVSLNLNDSFEQFNVLRESILVNSQGVENESQIPKIVSVLSTDAIFPIESSQFQNAIDDIVRSEILRNLSPSYANNENLIGKFNNLSIDLESFRKDIVDYLNLFKPLNNNLKNIRFFFSQTSYGLAKFILERIGYLKGQNNPASIIDLDLIPTTFFVDCLISYAYELSVIGSKFKTIRPIDNNSVAYSLGRNLNFLLKCYSEIDSLENFSFNYQFPANSNTKIFNLGFFDNDNLNLNDKNLPFILGGKNHSYMSFPANTNSQQIISITQPYVNTLRNFNGFNLNSYISNLTDSSTNLKEFDYARLLLDPLVRECIRSFNNRDAINSVVFRGLDKSNILNKLSVVQNGLNNTIGLYKDPNALNVNSDSFYDLADESQQSARSLFSIKTNEASILPLENGSIVWKEGNINSKPLIDGLKNNLLINDNVFVDTLNKLDSSSNNFRNYVNFLNQYSNLPPEFNHSQFINQRIKPCIESMFSWSNNSQNVYIGQQNNTDINHIIARVWETPRNSTDGTPVYINGLEILLNNQYITPTTQIRNPGPNDETLMSKLFDLCIQECFEIAYIRQNSSQQAKEALNLIMFYFLLNSFCVSSEGNQSDSFVPYGANSPQNSTQKNIAKSFVERFKNSFYSPIGLNRKTSLYHDIEFKFAFLSLIKQITEGSRVSTTPNNRIFGYRGVVNQADISTNISTVLEFEPNTNRDSFKFNISDLNGLDNEVRSKIGNANQVDFLSFFGGSSVGFNSYYYSLQNNPFFLAAYIMFSAPSIVPSVSYGNDSINPCNMASKFLDKFLELNGNCFDANNTNCTKNMPYTIEQLLSIAIRISIEGLLASNIYNQKTTNPVEKSRKGGSGLNNYLRNGNRLVIRSIAAEKLRLRYINTTTNYLTVSSNIQNFSNLLVSELISSLQETKDCLAVLNRFQSLLSELPKITNKIKENYDLQSFKYIKTLANDKTQTSNISKNIISSITSGYSANLLTCQNYSTQINSNSEISKTQMNIMDKGIEQKFAILISALIMSWGYKNLNSSFFGRSTKINKSVKSSKSKILSVGIPNGFMSYDKTQNFNIPIKSNAILNNESANTTVNEINGLRFSEINLKIFKKDLRFNPRNNRDTATPIIYKHPIDLRIIGAKFKNEDFYLKNFEINSLNTQNSDYPYPNSVIDGTRPLISSILNNCEFYITKIDKLTGDEIQDSKTTITLNSIGSSLNQIPLSIRNMIVSYCLKLLYTTTSGLSVSEQILVSDNLFFEPLIPVNAIEQVKQRANLFEINGNLINTILDNSSRRNYYGINFSTVNLENFYDKNEKNKAIAYIMSACNQLQSSSGFLRAISPKAFEQVMFIPIDLERGIVEDVIENYNFINPNTQLKFLLEIDFLNTNNSLTRNRGGDLFNIDFENKESQLQNRWIESSGDLNDIITTQIWVELD